MNKLLTILKTVSTSFFHANTNFNLIKKKKIKTLFFNKPLKLHGSHYINI